jgi:hypothetical protein
VVSQSGGCGDVRSKAPPVGEVEVGASKGSSGTQVDPTW